MIEFRVITITNDLDKFPQFQDDTDEFPELVETMEHYVETLVVDPRDGCHWRASEFFNNTDVTRIIVDTAEVPE